MARFVKTQREVEGRFEDVFALVDDDDDLVTWTDEDTLDLVGTPVPRADGPARVSGAARFTVDTRLAGMLHGAIVRSPVAVGRVVSLRLDAARAVPGVRAALGPAGSFAMTGDPLLTGEPSFAGEPLAALAADTSEALAAGLRALELELETAVPRVGVDQGLVDQRFTEDPVEGSRGDVDAAWGEADVRVELACETPSHLQTPLEPHAAVARWDGDELTVWVSTQGIFDARAELARRFGLPPERVRVIAEYVGGAFGAKQGAGAEGVLAAELARATGRPVRIVNDRHAEQLAGGRRPATRQTVAIGAKRDGTLVAVEATAVLDMGLGGWVPPVTEPARSLYAVEHVRTMHFPVRTSLRAANAFRAPGVVEGTAVFEQAVDELASALGLDPLELRRRNHVERDQTSGLPYSSKRLLECYERAAELAGWARRSALQEPQPDGLLRGMGCATQIWWGGGGPPAHATIRLDSRGHALVTTGIQDIGTGTLTGARVVAAEELGLPLASVTVRGGDTGPNVYAPLSAGSMTTPAVMPAVRSAAAKVRRALLQLAADVLEIAAADLVVSGGRIRSRDGALDVDVVEVTGKLGNATIDGSGSRGPNPDGVRVNTFGCQIATVAVDPGLGDVRVERVVAVHDVGRILNPLTASSQVEGGILQGIGFALLEEAVVDPTTGVPVNAHLDDYKLPTIADVPEIVVDFPNLADRNLPNVGAKGLGEPPIIPTAAAIANAFAYATGRRPAALPLTRARVLEALA
jgi:xanthine dehydrogenase YagR molybdenum-binding subunit